MRTLNQEESISFLRALAKGINPYTRSECRRTDMLRDPKIVDGIHEVILSFIDLAKKNKVMLQFDRFAVKEIEISDEEKTIGLLAEFISSTSNFSKTRLIRVIQDYLVYFGYLEVKPDNLDHNSNKKFATPKGEKIGIKTFVQTSSNGKTYHCTRYSTAAQQFVISQLDEIANFFNNSIKLSKKKDDEVEEWEIVDLETDENDEVKE